MCMVLWNCLCVALPARNALVPGDEATQPLSPIQDYFYWENHTTLVIFVYIDERREEIDNTISYNT